MKNLLKPFSVFLSINILIVPLAAATPQNKSLKIHVGYIGEKLENVPDGYQKLVRQKMLGLINQNYYEFHNPVDLTTNHGDAVKAVLAHNKDSFNSDLASLSEVADLDYLFVTTFTNISDDVKRVMLKGEVVRFNRKTNDVYRHEVLSYAEDLDLHIRAMKSELVETIPHSVSAIGRNKIYLFLGVGLVLIFALSQSFGGFDQWIGGGDGGKDTDPPVGN